MSDRKPADVLMGARRHHAEGGKMKLGGRSRRRYATGGPATADTIPMKRGGRSSTKNPHTGHPGYGFLGNLLGKIPIIGGFAKMLPFSEGGHTLAEDFRDKSYRLHRARGGAGKTRKNYPYTK